MRSICGTYYDQVELFWWVDIFWSEGSKEEGRNRSKWWTMAQYRSTQSGPRKFKRLELFTGLSPEMSHIKGVVYRWKGLVKTHPAMYFGQKNILYRGRNSPGILIIVIVVTFWCHCLVTPIAKNINRQSGSLCALKLGEKEMYDSSSTIHFC